MLHLTDRHCGSLPTNHNWTNEGISPWETQYLTQWEKLQWKRWLTERWLLWWKGFTITYDCIEIMDNSKLKSLYVIKSRQGVDWMPDSFKTVSHALSFSLHLWLLQDECELSRWVKALLFSTNKSGPYRGNGSDCGFGSDLSIWIMQKKKNHYCRIIRFSCISLEAMLKTGSCPLSKFTIHSVLINAAPLGLDQKA